MLCRFHCEESRSSMISKRNNKDYYFVNIIIVLCYEALDHQKTLSAF